MNRIAVLVVVAMLLITYPCIPIAVAPAANRSAALHRREPTPVYSTVADPIRSVPPGSPPRSPDYAIEYVVTEFANLSDYTYFDCTFSQPNRVPPNTDFPRDPELSHQPEKGHWDWVERHPGDPVMRLVPDPADGSRYCLELTRQAGSNETVHDKLSHLMGDHPELWAVEPWRSMTKGAYWSFKVWVPSDLHVSKWLLIWQYCGHEDAFGVLHTNPHLQLTFVPDLYLVVDDYYDAGNVTQWTHVLDFEEIPKDQWIRIVVYVQRGSSYLSRDGTVTVWINDDVKLDRSDLSTGTAVGRGGIPASEEHLIVWGIANYGQGAIDSTQQLLFKDVAVTSSYPLGEGGSGGPQPQPIPEP